MIQYDSKSGYFSAHLPWVRADGPEEKTGVQKNRSDRIKAAYLSWLVGRGATDFIAPWMICGFTAMSP